MLKSLFLMMFAFAPIHAMDQESKNESKEQDKPIKITMKSHSSDYRTLTTKEKFKEWEKKKCKEDCKIAASFIFCCPCSVVGACIAKFCLPK
jgi:hypothetical protein